MDVCPHVSVLCCPVSVEALCRADPQSKESYQNVSICRLRKPIRVGQRSARDCAFFFFFKKRYSCPCALTENHTIKVYWESGGIEPHILDLGTRWRWVVSFTPWPLYPGTHWTGGWVGPRASLDVVKIKNLSEFFIIPHVYKDTWIIRI
jgi:hypothetical protein